MYIKYLLMIIHFMFAVGFFMYIERKFLGLAQFRMGPNKVYFKGFIQFLFDMVKLFMKNLFDIYNFMFFTYFFMPVLLFFNMLIMWFILPFNSIILNVVVSMIYLIVLMLLKMFYMVLMIFFIYSSYGFISMVRMVIQIVSYDIIIILVFLFNFIIYVEFSLHMYVKNLLSNFYVLNLLVFLFWFMSIMVELIRLPFDFYEGESELISGFNIEYGSFYFLILVLVEYMEMIYFMMLTVLIFLYSFIYSFVFNLYLFLFIFFLVWLRVFFIRYRMDKMLIVLWKFIFPLMMLLIFLYYYFNLI